MHEGRVEPDVLAGVNLDGAIRRFRVFADEFVGKEGPATMDWSSRLWLDGTRRCVNKMGCYLSRENTVLDFGCGLGLVSALLATCGYQVSGVDIDAGNQPEVACKSSLAPWASLEEEIRQPGMMENMWKGLEGEFGVQFKNYDGQVLPWSDQSFNAAVAHGVIEHISPSLLPMTFQELFRVLSPGGYLFIFRTPRDMAYLEKLARMVGLPTHDLTYDERLLEDLMKVAGFTVMERDVSDLLPSFLPFAMGAYNLMAPLFTRLDAFLLRTPLRKYAHHMSLVCRKPL